MPFSWLIALVKSVAGKGQEFFYPFLVDDMPIRHLPSLLRNSKCAVLHNGLWELVQSTHLMLASLVQSVNLAENQMNSLKVLQLLRDVVSLNVSDHFPSK